MANQGKQENKASEKTEQESGKKEFVHRILGFKGLRIPHVTMDGRTLAVPTEKSRLSVPTTLSHSEMMGEFMRRAPDKSLWIDFENILLDMADPKGRRVYPIMGDPGLGKTYKAHTISRMMTGRRAVVINCSNVHLQDVLFKIVMKDGEPVVVEGEFFEALKTLKEQGGGVILLNEFSAAKPGTDKYLNEFFQLLIREADGEEIIFTPKGSDQQIRISMDDIGNNTMVLIDGNLSHDGMQTHDLTDSVISRIDPKIRRSEFLEDWVKRYFQSLTDVPVSWILEGNPEFLTDEQKAVELFLAIRKLGRTGDQIAKLPKYQEDILRNWRPIMRGLHKASEFWLALRDLTTDPSYLQRVRTGESNLDDETIQKAWHIDKRLILRHVSQSLRPTVEKIALEDDQKVVNIKDSIADLLGDAGTKDLSREELMATFGDRYCEWVINWINEKTVNLDPGLEPAKEQFIELAKKYGILESDEKSNSNEEEMVAHLLNIDNSKELSFDADLEELQKEIGFWFQYTYPDRLKDTKVEDIVNLGELQFSANEIHASIKRSEFTNDSFVVVNDDYAHQNSGAKAEPLSVIQIYRHNGEEITKWDTEGSLGTRLQSDALSLEQFVHSLSLSNRFGQINLMNLWANAGKRMLESISETSPNMTQEIFDQMRESNDFMSLAMNQDGGFGLTFITCVDRSDKATEFINATVLVNANAKGAHTIIIANSELRDDVYEFAKEKGIRYVQVNKNTTAKDIEAVFNEEFGTEFLADKDNNQKLNQALEHEFSESLLEDLEEVVRKAVEGIDDEVEAAKAKDEALEKYSQRNTEILAEPFAGHLHTLYQKMNAGEGAYLSNILMRRQEKNAASPQKSRARGTSNTPSVS